MKLEKLSAEAIQLAASCQAVVNSIRTADPSKYTKEERIKTRDMAKNYFNALEAAFKKAESSGERRFFFSSTRKQKEAVLEAMTREVAKASRCLLYLEAFVAGHINPGDVLSEAAEVVFPLRPKAGKHKEEIKALYEAIIKTPNRYNMETQVALFRLSLAMKNDAAGRIETIYNNLVVKHSPKYRPLKVFSLAEQQLHTHGFMLSIQIAIDE